MVPPHEVHLLFRSIRHLFADTNKRFTRFNRESASNPKWTAVGRDCELNVGRVGSLLQPIPQRENGPLTVEVKMAFFVNSGIPAIGKNLLPSPRIVLQPVVFRG